MTSPITQKTTFTASVVRVVLVKPVRLSRLLPRISVETFAPSNVSSALPFPCPKFLVFQKMFPQLHVRTTEVEDAVAEAVRVLAEEEAITIEVAAVSVAKSGMMHA
jgi:hypothetical protein